KGTPIPEDTYQYNAGSLKPIPYKEIKLDNKWEDYDIRHELTTKGMERFSEDWKRLIKPEKRKIA
ncbi:MAG TPA: transaldolase, partial [Nitrospirota bacterium]|nr:transaldolase [Nitrospirota bacterium]